VVPTAAHELPPPASTGSRIPAPDRILKEKTVINFANGKARVPHAAVDSIRKLAIAIRTGRSDYDLVVSGHTSSVGSLAFNKALSKHRAAAVTRILRRAGIPESSIQTVGAGPYRPMADDRTPEGSATNRRTEIEVVLHAAR
jgi:outer membrane protein OmpA-like peptidoglycan-associated protein